MILYSYKEETPMYRKSKAKIKKAIDLKFLSDYEKQSHEIPMKRNKHNLQVRGRKQNREAYKESMLKNLEQWKASYTGSKPIAFQILGRVEVQDRISKQNKRISKW